MQGRQPGRAFLCGTLPSAARLERCGRGGWRWWWWDKPFLSVKQTLATTFNQSNRPIKVPSLHKVRVHSKKIRYSPLD